jgi:hypothetical protein
VQLGRGIVVSIFGSHQRCDVCGWTGITRAHRLTVVCVVTYLAMVPVVLALEVFEIASFEQIFTWPVVIAMLAWYHLPKLLWRRNACGGCGQPIQVELLSNRAPSSDPGP